MYSLTTYSPEQTTLKRYKPVFVGVSIGIILSVADLGVDLIVKKETLPEMLAEHGSWYVIEDSLLFVILGLSLGIMSWRKVLYAQQLSESEERYRQMAENSLTGIYLFQESRFRYVNPRFSEILEYTPHDLIGMKAWDIVHPEERARIRDIALRRERGEDVPSQYETRAITKSGRTVWVEIRATLIHHKGKPAVFGNFIDISERKNKEEMLAKNNAILSTVRKYMEDVLKNNYQVIEGYTEYIPDEKIRGIFEKMCLEGTEFIENIETFVALHHDSPTPRVEEQHLEELIHRCARYVKHRLPEAEILCEGEMNVRVMASPFLSRAIINLLINAVVHGSSPRVRIHTQVEGECVLMSVLNHGKPISEERVTALMQDGRSGGSGFGLKLATDIIESGGGRWWIETQQSSHPEESGTNINKFNLQLQIKK